MTDYGLNNKSLQINQVSWEEALYKYFTIVGQYEDQLPEDELIDDLTKWAWTFP